MTYDEKKKKREVDALLPSFEPVTTIASCFALLSVFICITPIAFGYSASLANSILIDGTIDQKMTLTIFLSFVGIVLALHVTVILLILLTRLQDNSAQPKQKNDFK